MPQPDRPGKLGVRRRLAWSVVCRTLLGEVPTIDLVLGYHKANRSPVLRLFLAKVDELIARVGPKPGEPSA